jgi:hypothetical protein
MAAHPHLPVDVIPVDVGHIAAIAMKKRCLHGLAIACVVVVVGTVAPFLPVSLGGQGATSVATVATVATVANAAHRALPSQEHSSETSQEAIAVDHLPEVTTIYFPQTGHHLSNRAGFLDFWRENGQVLIFGYPISEEMVVDGRVVQYFERARFEHYPEREGTEWEVQLGRLGVESIPAPAPQIANPYDGSRYFPETGHTLRGEFLRYWERRGGARIFGLPISEQVVEDGRTYQYFERAKFEHNPEDMELFYRNHEWQGLNLDTLYEVKLVDIGRTVAQNRGISTEPTKQLQGVPHWTPALWARRIDINLTAQQLTAYEDDLPVYQAPVTTGRPGFYTPTGEFSIYLRFRKQTMVGSVPGESWNVPNIPWVMYINGSVAIHGTYWHDLFGTGTLMSHGCINLGMDDAEWIYKWADLGTKVVVHY